ncbi:MAG: Kazal-type serine protease inhibitor domain-containing protein [Roseiarcus sp.]|jgi:hypothetical protein
MTGKALASTLLFLAFLAPAPVAEAQGFCTMLWAPVCALKDGVEKTYSNAGCAKADEATVTHEGPCGEKPAPPPSSRSVFCTDEYAPVCGVKNGVAQMYSNKCRAFADGATVANLGQCQVKR